MQEQRIDKYNKYVVAEDFLLATNYNSVMEFPFFLRAVINTTSKEYLTEKKQSVNALAACLLLSGQLTIPTRAKKSIAGFKLREGALIGCQTTLRKKRLYTIIDKLLIFVLPRLYSEKKNDTLIEMANLLVLKRGSKTCSSLQTQQKQVTATKKRVSFTEKRKYSIDQALAQQSCAAQDTKVLSQEERSQLSVLLNFLKEGNNKNVAKFEKIASKGPIYNLTLGIKDLLLLSELQEFLPLFESVRGINIGVSFSNPRIKGTRTLLNFVLHSFAVQQSYTAKLCNRVRQTLVPQVLGEKVSKDFTYPHNLPEQVYSVKKDRRLFDSEQVTHFTFTYNTVDHKQAKERVSLSFDREAITSYAPFPNTKTEKPSLQNFIYEKKHAINTFCIFLDTPLSKDKRKTFFLTCFQYPRQYN